ncbi:hypothetical protein LCGC14_2142580, partial [marine sediment metagenome]
MNLVHSIGNQLNDLLSWASLPKIIQNRLIRSFEILTKEALNQRARTTYSGLANINPNGLPFQWSFCEDSLTRSVRFLCECGIPGTSSISRYRLSLLKLHEVFEVIGIILPHSQFNKLLNIVVPDTFEWPKSWQSALWIA